MTESSGGGIWILLFIVPVLGITWILQRSSHTSWIDATSLWAILMLAVVFAFAGFSTPTYVAGVVVLALIAFTDKSIERVAGPIQDRLVHAVFVCAVVAGVAVLAYAWLN